MEQTPFNSKNKFIEFLKILRAIVNKHRESGGGERERELFSVQIRNSFQSFIYRVNTIHPLHNNNSQSSGPESRGDDKTKEKNEAILRQ